eukprot:2536749-Amphidinium_carterae.1
MGELFHFLAFLSKPLGDSAAHLLGARAMGSAGVCGEQGRSCLVWRPDDNQLPAEHEGKCLSGGWVGCK